MKNTKAGNKCGASGSRVTQKELTSVTAAQSQGNGDCDRESVLELTAEKCPGTGETQAHSPGRANYLRTKEEK